MTQPMGRLAWCFTTLAIAVAVGLTTPNSVSSQCAEQATAEPASAESSRLTQEEIQKVVDYVFETHRNATNGDIQISPAQIEAATGVTVNAENQNQVLPVILAKLNTTPEGRAWLATAEKSSSCSATGQVSRCVEYGACSLQGNLAFAEGDALDMYVREKASDGETYVNLELPGFEVSHLDGRTLHSESLAGKPTVLVTLAVHCSHSHETLPILKELHNTYGPQGFQIVGVFVNSGSVEDLNDWIHDYKPNYDIWVHPEESLGDLVDSHLVPTYFLLDEKRMVQEKLVGFKTQDEVAARLDRMARHERDGNDAAKASSNDSGM